MLGFVVYHDSYLYEHTNFPFSVSAFSGNISSCVFHLTVLKTDSVTKNTSDHALGLLPLHNYRKKPVTTFLIWLLQEQMCKIFAFCEFPSIMDVALMHQQYVYQHVNLYFMYVYEHVQVSPTTPGNYGVVWSLSLTEQNGDNWTRIWKSFSDLPILSTRIWEGLPR